ncbi:hypothetical protein ABMA27_009783 [Loxostege sticticalis]|uniref:UDP-glucuronosyltransferase n=2 Tax=Loxostege sticticalis TaxID=481309 RepID=A0ABR3H6Q0_LOXSC
MSKLFIQVFCVIGLISNLSAGARILAYYPTPSISHQVAFRPLSLELAKRGHEVVVITADPIFPNGNAPKNLTEIDVHDLSYNLFKKMLTEGLFTGRGQNELFVTSVKLMTVLIEEQMKSNAVQEILKDTTKKFDLVIVEAYLEATLGLSHLYKVPVIQFGSGGGLSNTLQVFGAATHPLLYPSFLRRKINNRTLWEKVIELYDEFEYNRLLPDQEVFITEVMSRVFGPDVPKLEELRKNVDMIFLNVHSFWDFNRPVPPNVVYLGGIHQKPAKELPTDLQEYLDSSKNGVIYVSFGSNVDPAFFPPETIQLLVNVFSKLPYDVLFKWNLDELPGRTPNIRISKWLPQSDLLRHPKIKLFITQCGLQSTDEAITAGVPLLGIPIVADQEYNSEQYLYHGIGVIVDIGTITEETLNKGINTILQDESYRNNILRLRSRMLDQPQTPLERAVWWTEYVIRHSGARHLRASAANMSWHQYYELELVIYLVLAVLTALILACSVIYCLLKKVFGVERKVKRN